ncbi:hypothetical protein B0J17DRAFT_670315 [Rhizoctonia solani]|nr:hypothetical protein B0J17DRAFT_670315 [Rhizoctonia solani]
MICDTVTDLDVLLLYLSGQFGGLHISKPKLGASHSAGAMISVVQQLGEQPCSTCGKCDKDSSDAFFVHCRACNRLWHNACLYTRVPQDEIFLRNSKDPGGRGRGWQDWKCRQCRGVGPEGREHRQTQNQIDLTLIDDDDDDDEIEVLSAAPTGLPARQASIPLLAQPRSEVPPHSTAPPRSQTLSRPPPPPEILPPSYRPPPQANIPPRSEPLIEPPGSPIQDEPMLDLNDLSLGERPPTPPPPEFPSFAKQVDAPKHHFEPMGGTPRPGPSLPPALRTRSRTVLGQRMQDIVSSDKLVQNLGIKGLKAMGWKTEKRERIASVEPPVIPTWARPANDKGKGRDPGERRPRPITELRLVPPRLQIPEIKSGSESYPSRKPRKSSIAMHRDNTVKLEPIDLSFS